MKKATLGLALVAAVAALPHPSFAQGSSAPGLMNVKEVVLHYTRIGTPKAAAACGIVRESLLNSMTRILKMEAVPVTPIPEIKPPIIGVARVELIPEIASISTQSGDCTSWVGLSAQTQNTVRVPPIDTPRTVIVTYWRSGLLVNSNVTGHGNVIDETFQKLAKSFAKQYQLDQPPPVPNFDEEEDVKKAK